MIPSDIVKSLIQCFSSSIVANVRIRGSLLERHVHFRYTANKMKITFLGVSLFEVVTVLNKKLNHRRVLMVLTTTLNEVKRPTLVSLHYVLSNFNVIIMRQCVHFCAIDYTDSNPKKERE